MRVDVTVDIGAPPEVVWAVLSDLHSASRRPGRTGSVSARQDGSGRLRGGAHLGDRCQ